MLDAWIKNLINRALIKCSSTMLIRVNSFEKLMNEIEQLANLRNSLNQTVDKLIEEDKRQKIDLVSSRYAAEYYSTGIHYLETKLQSLQGLSEYTSEINLLQYFLLNFTLSSSQLLSDLLAGFLFEGIEGTFVEFGAADGVTLSNTYFLEKHLNWKGLLAEPVRGWHEELHKNRKCLIVHQCVYSESNIKVRLLETPDKMLSTIVEYRSFDMHALERNIGLEYEDDTISLEELLILHLPDQKIQFLSIDTEGTELTILEKFDFSRFEIDFIAVEHNFNPNRAKLRDLLVNAGYIRVLERVSRWDDWWVKSELLSRFQNPDAVQGGVGDH
jgi:hypothetical protein